jgi:hypothetical protein
VSAEPDRITAHAHDTAHVAEGAALFARYWADKLDAQAVARAYLLQVQDLEDTLWALLEQADLENAEGAQLDQIGELVLLPRGVLSDDALYRPLLRAGIRARRSAGTGEDLLAIATLALQGTGITFSLTEHHAGVVVEPHAPLPASFAPVFLRVLRLGKSGAVQLQLFDPPGLEAGLFTLAAPGALLPASDANRGFGQDAGGTGGHLTSVVT